MEEDFDNVSKWWLRSYTEDGCVYYGMDLIETAKESVLHMEDVFVLEGDYNNLLNRYKDLKERHQKLLDIAGGHYL